jgi:hypothetical protein
LSDALVITGVASGSPGVAVAVSVAVHVLEPATDTVPARHGVGPAAPPVAYVPAGVSMQLLAPGTEE